MTEQTTGNLQGKLKASWQTMWLNPREFLEMLSKGAMRDKGQDDRCEER